MVSYLLVSSSMRPLLGHTISIIYMCPSQLIFLPLSVCIMYSSTKSSLTSLFRIFLFGHFSLVRKYDGRIFVLELSAFSRILLTLAMFHKRIKCAKPYIITFFIYLIIIWIRTFSATQNTSNICFHL